MSLEMHMDVTGHCTDGTDGPVEVTEVAQDTNWHGLRVSLGPGPWAPPFQPAERPARVHSDKTYYCFWGVDSLARLHQL